MGVLWSFLLPLVMLVTYTFVFSVVFKAKFDLAVGSTESKLDFAFMLFCGILLYTVFQESVGAASTVIQFNVSYVKKVVFPLEILPVVKLAAALVHTLISTGILIVAVLALRQTISPTLWLFPLILVPLIMFTMGLSWFLASVGVYIRDVGHVVGVILTILFFLSPIFYPVSRLPEKLQIVMRMNILTVFIENGRFTLLAGRWPDWWSLAIAFAISALIMQGGYAWFMKTKRGFADVV